MFQPKRSSPVKTLAILGAIALLLIPTYALIREDIAQVRHQQFEAALQADHDHMVIAGIII
jgi:hypothetical protein